MLILHSLKFRMALISAALLVAGGTATVLAATPPASPTPGGTLAARVDQRKAERGVVLDEASTQRIVSGCVNSQNAVRKLQNPTTTILDNHTKVYQTIDARLWAVTGQLKLANKDTFTLEKDRLVLADKATDFQATATNYQQTLDDITVINCKADPIGFKALLETAQAYYAQLQTKSISARDYIVNTIKPELGNHVSGLQVKPSPKVGS